MATNNNKTKAQLEEENEELKSQYTDLMAQMEEMKRLIAQMQTSATVATPVINNMGARKIKVCSLINNVLNLSTDENGTGRVFTFHHYGETRSIKFDILEDIVQNHREQAEQGYFYIADEDAVRELGLTEEYEHLCDKKTMDKVLELRTQDAVDMFLNLSPSLRTHIADMYIENVKNGKEYNLNFLRTIKNECGIDIEESAEQLKNVENQTQAV